MASLLDARAERDKARKLLLEERRDPAIVKRLKKEANIQAGRNTFEKIAREWRATSRSQWALRHADDVIRSLERDVFPVIGALRISELRPPTIVKLLAAGRGRDPRFSGHVPRGDNQKELDDLIADWNRTRTVAEVEAAMIEHSVPAGKIYRAPEMLEDPHFAARNSLITLDHPRWGKIVMQNAFPRLSETPSSVRTLAPATPGQDNGAVYGALLGLDAEALASLAPAEVV